MTKAEKEDELKLVGYAFMSIETWDVTIDGWKVTVCVYDGKMREHLPNVISEASILEKGPKSLAVAISSTATLKSCESCAAEMLKEMGIELEAGCELHQKVCNDIGQQLLSYGQRYGEEDNGNN